MSFFDVFLHIAMMMMMMMIVLDHNTTLYLQIYLFQLIPSNSCFDTDYSDSGVSIWAGCASEKKLTLFELCNQLICVSIKFQFSFSCSVYVNCNLIVCTCISCLSRRISSGLVVIIVNNLLSLDVVGIRLISFFVVFLL